MTFELINEPPMKETISPEGYRQGNVYHGKEYCP